VCSATLLTRCGCDVDYMTMGAHIVGEMWYVMLSPWLHAFARSLLVESVRVSCLVG
jgi:hypothetical protein